MNKIEILATGSKLIRKNVRGIEPVIAELITQARSEIQILAYLFTPPTIYLIGLLENAADRGALITMIINSLNTQHEIIRKEFQRLVRRYHNFRVFNFPTDIGQLHAKLLIVDRKKAVLGSANFSWGGMSANYEVGLLIEGKIVWKLAEMIDTIVEIVQKSARNDRQ